MAEEKEILPSESALLRDIYRLIEEARVKVASTVNAALTMLYWRVGKRIGPEILKGDMAEYGEKIVHALRTQLSWTHFRFLIANDDPLKRDLYTPRVAEYLTELPAREILEKQFHKALVQARKRFLLSQHLNKEESR